jgi:hypothetical protein
MHEATYVFVLALIREFRCVETRIGAFVLRTLTTAEDTNHNGGLFIPWMGMPALFHKGLVYLPFPLAQFHLSLLQ